MADEIEWLPVLQKVFADYGTQLRKSKVKKFAAKEARQQGRHEDKAQLRSSFKAFLKSAQGRSSVLNKDDVLSLGSPEPAGPSQPKLSLLDLAEAAANFSKQPARAQPRRQPAKSKPGQKALGLTTGPRAIRKRRESSSPDAAAALQLTSAGGMQTRGKTRRQSLDLQADDTPMQQLEHAPLRFEAAEQKPAAIVDQPEQPEGDHLGAAANADAVQSGTAPSKAAASTDGPDTAADKHVTSGGGTPAAAHTMPEAADVPKEHSVSASRKPASKGKKHRQSDASPAATSDSPAQAPPSPKLAVEQQTDASKGVDVTPSLTEQAGKAVAGQHATTAQHANTAQQDKDKPLTDPAQYVVLVDTQHERAAARSRAAALGADHVADQAAVKAKKQKQKKGTGSSHQHASASDMPTEAPGASVAAALDGSLGQQQVADVVAQQPTAQKKRKPKIADSTKKGIESATAKQLPDADAVLTHTTAPNASVEVALKSKKHKRKHRDAADDSKQPAADSQLPQAQAREPAPGLQQQEAADAAAAAPEVLPSVKAKKHKLKHNKLPTSAADAAPVHTAAGAAGPSQLAQEPVAAAPQEPSAKSVKKKKKKHTHMEYTGVDKHTASAAAEDDVDDALPNALGVEVHEPEVPVHVEPPGQAAPGEPAAVPKKQKKKKKRKHSNDADKAKQATSAAAAVQVSSLDSPESAARELVSGPPSEHLTVPDQTVEPPAGKPKKKKKRRHQDGKDTGQPPAATAEDTGTASAPSILPEQPDAPASLPDAPASEPAVVPSKKRKHNDSVGNGKHATTPTVHPVPEQQEQQTAAASGDAGDQAAAKPKRRRKSKAALPDGEAAAEAATGAPAEAAAGQAARAKKAKAAKAAKASDPAGLSASASGLNSWRASQARTDVKKGKFTKQEKETLKQAAQSYAQEHSLPSEDFGWLFNTRGAGNKREAAGAWQTIAQCLPHRTYKSVYACGTRMLHELNYQGKWSKDEDDQLRELVGEKGSKWKEISMSLSRLPEGCRDRWRELKLGTSKLNGRWSEEETAKLRELVNEYLARKQEIEEQTQAGDALTLTLGDLESSPGDADSEQADGRIILDDIDWDVISARHGTRAAAQCLTKWYTQLAPSMVSKGEWGSGDDRRLLRALARTGARHDFQVEWGQLVASRTAMQARRRWRLMLKCVRDAADREFHENLRTLLQTFTPDLLPAHEDADEAHDPEAVDDLS